jgi:hypothetical protein
MIEISFTFYFIAIDTPASFTGWVKAAAKEKKI